MSKHTAKLFCIACLGLTLAACETTPTKDEEVAAVEERTVGTAEGLTEEEARTRGIAGPGGFRGDVLEDPASPLATRVIYFDYDSADIRDEYRSVIEAHAAYLSTNPETRILLEGHTDERGSREYNIGLGERRAQSVERLVLLLGAGQGQVQSVSYGEENPAAFGADEATWEQNRRVQIIYELP